MREKRERPYIRSNKVISREMAKPKVKVEVVVDDNGQDRIRQYTYTCINTHDQMWVGEAFLQKIKHEQEKEKRA